MALNFPNNPTDGQVWTDTANGVEYTYKLDDDSWTGTLSSANAPVNPSPSDVTATPAFGNPSGSNPGSGTVADPYMITTSVVGVSNYNVKSDQFITITKGSPGNQVLFLNNTTPAGIADKFTQPVGVIDAAGKWEGYLYYNDDLGDDTASDSSYTGNLQVGSTSVYFRWVVQQMLASVITVDSPSRIINTTNTALLGSQLTVNNPLMSGGSAPYTYAYQWQTSSDDATYTNKVGSFTSSYTSIAEDVGQYIRCNVTVTDSAGVAAQTIVSPSNSINIISLAVFVNNTAPEPGATVSADLVSTGGEQPETTTYQWLADNSNISGATNQSYTIPADKAGKRLSVKVTIVDNVPSTVEVTSAQTDPVDTPIVYDVEASTRFNPEDDAYLNRTPTSAGNRKTWTWSGWVKRASTDDGGNGYVMFSAGDDYATNNGSFLIRFDADMIDIYQYIGGTNLRYITYAVYRDLSAWYHIVVAVDTTNPTEGERVLLYVNGSKVQDFSTETIPDQNINTLINSTVPHQIGKHVSGVDQYFDGYISNVNFVDSLQLDASSFGKTDQATGKWIPKEYTTYIPTGPVYSNDVTNSETGPNLFDGNVTTWCEGTYWSGSNPRKTAKFEPTSAIPINSTFELFVSYALPYEGSGLPNPWIRINNSTTIAAGTLTNNSWNTITGFTELTELQFQEIAAQWPMKISAIRVDGEILTDDWGYNSFQLAMDPSVVGSIWSSYCSGPVYSGGQNYQQAFNGETTGEFCVASVNNAITFTPPSPIPVNSTLEVYCRVQGSSGTLSVNGSDVTSQITNQTWSTITGISSISNIVWTTANPGSQSMGVWAIRVDGVILTDYTAIGADSSGLENNWYQNNLLADGGNKVWTGITGDTSNALDSVNAFDGNLATFAQNNVSTQPIEFLNLGITGATTLEYYTVSTGGYDVYINDSSYTVDTPSGSGWRSLTQYLAAEGGVINKIGLKHAASTVNKASVNAFMLNGVLLTNPQFSDLLRDSPSDFDDGIYGTGNYCTLNPLDTVNDPEISNGNLSIGSSGDYGRSRSTIGFDVQTSTGLYAEFTVTSSVHSGLGWGIIQDGTMSDSPSNGAVGMVNLASRGGNGNNQWWLYNDGTSVESTEITHEMGDVVGCDVKDGTVTFTINNAPAGTITGLTGTYFFVASANSQNSAVVNFGQYIFTYPKPAGYSTLCTFNLPNPVITYGDSGMQPVTYTGNGSTQVIHALGFEPGLTWIKARNATNSNNLYDIVRGANNYLSSNNTDPQGTATNELMSFNSNGVTLGDGGAVNGSGKTYVAWNWYAGHSTVTVPVGAHGSNLPSVETEVRANPETGFSIVSWTGTGANASVAHGLNATPKLIITKGDIDSQQARSWIIGCTYNGFNWADDYFQFDSSAKHTDSAGTVFSSAPTSTVFNVGSSSLNDGEAIAYCFAEVAGYSHIGSYLGSSSLPFVWCGFDPAYLMIKGLNNSRNWRVWDNARSTYNPTDRILYPSNSDEEVDVSDNSVLFLSNGFQLNNTNNQQNGAGEQYIFVAFASSPFKYSNAH